jgi:hypothetical protein
MTQPLTAEPIRSYQDSTWLILGSLGEGRLEAMQQRLKQSEVPDIDKLDLPEAIDHMVRKHVNGQRPDLSLLGYGTIADALEEVCDSTNATTALVAGRLGITGAVKVHHLRAEEEARKLSVEDLREQGTANTPLIHIDEETGLHLVKLTTPEHCQFEGKSLVHCLVNIVTAKRYLERGAQLYSLRQDGVTPRVTIEIVPEQAVLKQLRGHRDRALHIKGSEYAAAMRSLGPLATYNNLPELINIDGLYTQNKV